MNRLWCECDEGMKQPCTSTAQIHSLLLFGRFPRCTIFFQFWEAGQFDQSPEQVIRPTMTARTLVALPFQPNYNGPHIPRAPVSGPGEIDHAVNPSNGWKSRIFPCLSDLSSSWERLPPSTPNRWNFKKSIYFRETVRSRFMKTDR